MAKKQKRSKEKTRLARAVLGVVSFNIGLAQVKKPEQPVPPPTDNGKQNRSQD
jgi:hypothetical protein